MLNYGWMIFCFIKLVCCFGSLTTKFIGSLFKGFLNVINGQDDSCSIQSMFVNFRLSIQSLNA